MGKKKKQRKAKKDVHTEDFGSCTFYCKTCEKEFDVEWQTIFDIQECTHGYVGFHTNDVYISCPDCGEIASDDDYDDIDLNVILNS
ncbi:hypothetical protein LGQ02_18415 [Bacillus shivajii]|uniref:hypothetical protein n=1 Tax=Bacillus shivajii TaxID=1983719 RepID=UPI001CFA406C|nr:hypothetical protein [Bacillus shivajii]UCZ52734.1 hypothetical protein LGQ02_18415 [Bacillus shivajii]